MAPHKTYWEWWDRPPSTADFTSAHGTVSWLKATRPGCEMAIFPNTSANVESASFAASLSPGGAVNGMANKGLRSVGVSAASSESSRAICEASFEMSSLLKLPWYLSVMARSFAASSREALAERRSFSLQPRDIRPMQSQT